LAWKDRLRLVSAIRILLAVAVFATVFALGVRPSWWLMEKLLTSDFSSQKDASGYTFSVLVRRTNENDRYAVEHYSDLGEHSKLVTEFKDQDLEAINSDLRASVSAESSHYVYFKVLKRAEEYTEVQLETPTTGDFWFKYSYRIERGHVRLLKSMGFGPMFGLAVAILPIFVGVLAIICGDRLLRLLAVTRWS